MGRKKRTEESPPPAQAQLPDAEMAEPLATDTGDLQADDNAESDDGTEYEYGMSDKQVQVQMQKHKAAVAKAEEAKPSYLLAISGDTLKQFLSLASNLDVGAVQIEIAPTGKLSYVAMASSQNVAVKAEVRAKLKGFEKPPENLFVRLPSKELGKILGKVFRSEVEFYLVGDTKMVLRDSSEEDKVVLDVAVEKQRDEMKAPATAYTHSLKENIRSEIGKAKMFSPYLTLDYIPALKKWLMRSVGRDATLTQRLSYGSEEGADTPCSVHFDLERMQQIIKGASGYGSCLYKFAKNCPLQLEYEFGGYGDEKGKATYWLACRADD